MSVLQRCPDNQTAYLLLDGAQFESTEKWLYSHTSTPYFHHLYENTDMANARDVSPCLVELNKPGQAHLADQFSAFSNAHSSGILLSTYPEVSINTLLKHLQSLLYATCELTPKAVFRWYDPRVCRHLLECSSNTEQAELLGPVQTILIPTADGWTEFHNPGQQTRSNTPYPLSQHQLAALDGASQQVFQERLQQHLSNCYPDTMANKTATEQNELCNDWIVQGKRLGFDDQLSLTLFCNTLAMLGAECIEAHSPYPNVSNLLLQKSPQTPQQRVAQAADLAANIVAAQQTLQSNHATGTESSHA
ncbi:DUF4123 domain-containing protein [Aliamphritea ceti]|uniref:DUF4123 domain-containing protein n=1 Tax=Aliamphritea ceti TaxID=1524258 RepID=UPI0021C3AA8E|nr:DUF4123 domain-containing protein [Aliamphritea ceti]